MNSIQSFGNSLQTENFWGEIAPCEHLVHIWESDNAFLDALEGFVAGGLRVNESVIVIATAAHLNALEDRLKPNFALEEARARDQYIPLLAGDVLAKFMTRGWPDEALFEYTVAQLLARARAQGRRVRAFGEMVAVLWALGDQAATIRLEHLWNVLCRKEEFSIFCAYPKAGFSQPSAKSIQEICAAHTRVLSSDL